MNDEIKIEIDDILKKINSCDVVKEYFKVAEEIKNSEDLLCFFKEKEFHKKNLVPSSSNTEDYLREKELYNNACEKIDNHPLIKNFRVLKEEVLNLVAEIKEIIEQWFM